MTLVIPVEICNMAVDHVATVEKDPSLRDIFPYALEQDARPELMSLRLVIRSFCAAASRHLFQHIVARSDSSVRGRNPLQRFVEISRSEYASHDLAGLLSPCLAQLSDLRVLKFRAPCKPSTRDHEETAIKPIVSALRYVALPRLEGLELFFPIAHDFGCFFPNHSTPLHIPMEDILRGLKYLALHVTTYTNELGQRYWSTPVLPAHAALPNDLHAAHPLRLVELAPNLAALLIRGTDVLPFYSIHFSPALRLTSLCLKRVLTTFDHFRALIDQCKDHLKHVELSLVQLHSGTWHAVLTRLCQLPHLMDFSINSCGYPATGPNAHLAGILLEPENPKPLESINFADYVGLNELRKFVDANRVALGLDPFERTGSRWFYAGAL
ncbi:protease inhibitor [Aspergillus similis]